MNRRITLEDDPKLMDVAVRAAENFCRVTANLDAWLTKEDLIMVYISSECDMRPELMVIYEEPKLRRAADDCLEDIGIRAAFRVIHAQKG